MTIEDGQNYFNGDGSTDYLGYEVAFMSNITIDEGPHLAVGSPYANGYYGAVHVINGTDAFFGGDTTDAELTVRGESGAYFVGMGLAQDLDMDGDGIEGSSVLPDLVQHLVGYTLPVAPVRRRHRLLHGEQRRRAFLHRLRRLRADDAVEHGPRR